MCLMVRVINVTCLVPVVTSYPLQTFKSTLSNTIGELLMTVSVSGPEPWAANAHREPREKEHFFNFLNCDCNFQLKKMSGNYQYLTMYAP